LSLSLLLTGCDWFVRTETQYVYVPVEILTVPAPEPVELLDLEFQVVSESNLQKFLEENKSRNGTIVFFAMDVRDYESMATNVAELRRYIEDQMASIKYYENAIKESGDIADELNKVSETD
jgi:hypothetical protein